LSPTNYHEEELLWKGNIKRYEVQRGWLVSAEKVRQVQGLEGTFKKRGVSARLRGKGLSRRKEKGKLLRGEKRKVWGRKGGLPAWHDKNYFVLS